MFGAVISEPCDHVPISGYFSSIERVPEHVRHGTIATVTTLIELGIIDVKEGATEKTVTLDTPAGLIIATAT